MLRIGIIGAGDMGQLHAACYARLPTQEHVEIAGIVGRHPSRVRRVANAFRVDGFTDPDHLLDDDTVQAIDVTYPSGLHRGIVTKALRAGKHVFSETPLALTTRDADAMIAEARKRRRLLLVAQVMRFVASYAGLREAVVAGRIGRPVFANASRLSRPFWRRKPPRPFELFGDVVVELMVHDFDVLNWILGRPRVVQGVGVVGPTGAVEHAVVTLGYGDAWALAEGSGLMPDHFPFTTALRVRGGTGMLDLTQRFLRGPAPKTEFLEYRTGRPPAPIRVRGVDPYLDECRLFVRCVQGREEPGRLGAGAARDALRVAEAAQAAIARGRPIRLSW